MRSIAHSASLLMTSSYVLQFTHLRDGMLFRKTRLEQWAQVNIRRFNKSKSKVYTQVVATPTINTSWEMKDRAQP